MNFVVRNCSERMLKIFKHNCAELKINLHATKGEAPKLSSLKQLGQAKLIT